jgi:hypothetical protein
VYVIYIRERYKFSLVCTFRMAIEFNVKVGVQGGALRFRPKNNNRCSIFIETTFSSIVSHMVIVLHDYHVCFHLDLHLDFRFLQTRGS